MTKKSINTISAAVIALLSLFFGSQYITTSPQLLDSHSSATIGHLFDQRISGVMVRFDGIVVRKLSDDNEGSRHQRFIVKVGERHTVLIAHNIDLAPRVPIDTNKSVSIFGQYEWNDKGGVVHWTHHDPQGVHQEGWIEYQGKIYQ